MKKHLYDLRGLVKQLNYSTLKIRSLRYLSLQPAEVAVYPLLALAHFHLGELAEANKWLTRTIKQRETLSTDSLIDLGAVYILLGQNNLASAILEQALVQQPDHALGLARLGLCRLQQDDLETALTLLTRSDALEPLQIAVLSNIAQVYRLQKHYGSAQRFLQQALDVLVKNQAGFKTQAVDQYQHNLDNQQLVLWVANDQFAVAEHWLDEQKINAINTVYEAWLLQYTDYLAEHYHHAQAEEILKAALKQSPDNIIMLSQLAQLAQVQGHFIQAMRLLKKALKQENNNIGLWVKLASTCLHRAEEQARQAAEKAVALAEALVESPTHPRQLIRQLSAQARNALAMVESHAQHYALAETLYRDILTDSPQFLPALQGLGQQQMQCGQIDEALALFEQVKTLDLIKGTSSLINARQFPDDEETLISMAKAAKAPSLEGSVRTGILFQLAAAWDNRHNYEQAFDFVTQANTASKVFLSYDGKAHRQSCARIRMACCEALYQHRPDVGVDSCMPVYVLGMPRSGTTLVEQIIAGHSDIFGAGELGIIPQLIQGLNRWERHVGSGRAYPDCLDDVTPYVSQGIANNILKELQEYAPDAKHIVDKLPHNFENIGVIKFFFPNAKIISVRRDPRDIALSNYFTDYQAKHGGMGFAYDLTDIGEQLADHNLLMSHWHRLFPGQILEINYEDIVEDLESNARKLLDYIGVDWQPEVLKFNELERPVKTASVWQVRQPIYKTSKAKWLRYQAHLAPLINGTNALIEWDAVAMITLPEPGFLTQGVALFKEGDFDGAELCFKKMLHHNPEHAACHYMVGLVYLNKAHMTEAITHIEKALKKTPWQREWRETLIKAYEATGQKNKAKRLKKRHAAKVNKAKSEVDLQDNDGKEAAPALAEAQDTDIIGLVGNYFKP